MAELSLAEKVAAAAAGKDTTVTEGVTTASGESLKTTSKSGVQSIQCSLYVESITI